MKKVFAVEMKRAINIGWIISILGVCFSICFDSWNDLMRALTSHTGSIHYFFWNSSWGGVCRTYFLPIFAAIPFATSFCKEYKNHSLSFIISRAFSHFYNIKKPLTFQGISAIMSIERLNPVLDDRLDRVIEYGLFVNISSFYRIKLFFYKYIIIDFINTCYFFTYGIYRIYL